MPNFKKNPNSILKMSGGGPHVMKMYGQGKSPIMMTKAQETLPENLKKEIRAKEAKECTHMNMYKPMKKHGDHSYKKYKK